MTQTEIKAKIADWERRLKNPSVASIPSAVTKIKSEITKLNSLLEKEEPKKIVAKKTKLAKKAVAKTEKPKVDGKAKVTKKLKEVKVEKKDDIDWIIGGFGQKYINYRLGTIHKKDDGDYMVKYGVNIPPTGAKSLSDAKTQLDKYSDKKEGKFYRETDKLDKTDKLKEKLSKDKKYDFLKDMSKDSIEKDIKRDAKPVGWRFKGKFNYKKPSEAEIKKGVKNGTVYSEKRPERSDVSKKRKL